MKKIFAVILFIPFVLSYSQSVADDFFYPINQIGNQWEYTYKIGETDYNLSEKVTDTVRINGNLYYKLECDWFSLNFLLREENNKVFRYTEYDSTETLLFDFNGNVGDEWKIPPTADCFWGEQITMVSKTDSVVTPGGTYYNCICFSHIPECEDAGTFNSWYAKGIGKVRYDEVYIWGGVSNLLDNYTVLTGIYENFNEIKNIDFHLSQNYPNPFNPTTVISYQLPVISKVQLKVYDVLGREVATLVDEEKPAGSYEVEFNGEGLTSGVYFYHLKAGDSCLIKKMLLLK